MLRACIDLTFGALLLWVGVSGIRSGAKYGIFPGFLIRTRATREKKPITFWAHIIFHSVLTVIAVLYLIFVIWFVISGIGAP